MPVSSPTYHQGEMPPKQSGFPTKAVIAGATLGAAVVLPFIGADLFDGVPSAEVLQDDMGTARIQETVRISSGDNFVERGVNQLGDRIANVTYDFKEATESIFNGIKNELMANSPDHAGAYINELRDFNNDLNAITEPLNKFEVDGLPYGDLLKQYFSDGQDVVYINTDAVPVDKPLEQWTQQDVDAMILSESELDDAIEKSGDAVKQYAQTQRFAGFNIRVDDSVLETSVREARALQEKYEPLMDKLQANNITPAGTDYLNSVSPETSNIEAFDRKGAAVKLAAGAAIGGGALGAAAYDQQQKDATTSPPQAQGRGGVSAQAGMSHVERLGLSASPQQGQGFANRVAKDYSPRSRSEMIEASRQMSGDAPQIG